MKLSDIKPYSKNAKKHSSKQIKQVAESIKAFGFNQEIVVDKEMTIIVGHGRFEAAKLLGLEDVPVKVVDLSETKANAYRLADNKLNESSWDKGLLIDELKALPEFEFALTGFTDIDLKEEWLVEKTLAERFGVPPFSILDTRQGYWAERKKAWHSKIKDKGESREGVLSNEDSLMGAINKGVSILDPVLAELSVKWFCPKNGKTFDCFAGDTVFGFVSASNGNSFTGIELRKEQADLNNKRTKEEGLDAVYICDDGQNVDKHIKKESMDMLFSCPPYFDLEVYSDEHNDASNQDTYEDFLLILKNAFNKAIDCLKDDRFAVIVVGDIRDKDGFYYGFPDDVKAVFKKAGLLLYNEMVLVESLGTLPQRVGNSMKNRKVGKCHQNVLVFYKGDTKNIKNNFEVIT